MRRYISNRLLSISTIAIGVGVAVFGVAYVGSWLMFGGAAPWVYLRQGHSSIKLVPSILIFGVTAICVVSFIRMFLENIGVMEPEDRWVDWRDEPLNLAEDSSDEHRIQRSSTGSRRSEEPWYLRSRIRSRRPSRAWKHWGWTKG